MKRLLIALVAAVALLALPVAPAQAATVFTLPGAFGLHSGMPAQLGGEVTDGHTVVPIEYNNWTLCTSCAGEEGAPLLDEAITTTAGPKVVFGYSLGARVAKHWIDTYGPDSVVPVNDLSFVLIGSNYGTANGGDLETPFAVTVVLRQYDPYADAPNVTSSPYYGLAWLNAAMGNDLHGEYESVSLTDPGNVKTTVGNVTYVYVPTKTLPLVSWLEPFAPKLAADLDNRYQPLIESAYNRPVVIPDPTPPAEPVVAEAKVDADEVTNVAVSATQENSAATKEPETGDSSKAEPVTVNDPAEGADAPVAVDDSDTESTDAAAAAE